MYGEHHLSHEQTRGGHDFITGLLCGAAVGAAVGLLFAPRAGSELRGQIVDSAGRFRQRANEGYKQATDAVNQTVERGQEAWQKGRETFDEVRASHT